MLRFPKCLLSLDTMQLSYVRLEQNQLSGTLPNLWSELIAVSP